MDARASAHRAALDLDTRFRRHRYRTCHGGIGRWACHRLNYFSLGLSFRSLDSSAARQKPALTSRQSP